MFTGIVTGIGTVRELTPIGAGADMRLVIATPWPDTGNDSARRLDRLLGLLPDRDRGRRRTGFAVDASAETLSKTTLGTWGPGTRVNLERSLRMGDELGGHIVSGHVDGVGEAVVGDAGERLHALAVPGARAAGPVHRGQGQRRRGRRIVDGQRGAGR